MKWVSAEVVAVVIVEVDDGRLVGDGDILRAEGPFPDRQYEELPSLQVPFGKYPFGKYPFEKYPSVDLLDWYLF